MAPMTFSGLHLYLSIILCLLSVFFIGKVNSECQEKYADGLGPNDKRIFTVGERATLKCDVSAEKAIDQIYWKYGNDVMSEASTVVDKFKHKFNVTVTNTTVSGILNKNYTLSWIVELDDSGKYNCTCTTNGIQFPVWVKRPCSKRKHIVTNTTESNITSMAIIEYLRTNQSIEISEKKPLNVSIRLDCLCTWPEIDRTFDGKWKLTTGGDSCTASKQCKAEFPVTLNTTHDTQDNMSSLKPAGCYSGQNTVTYRYQNVFASLGVTFDWKTCLSGQEYGFHIDGGDDPVFKVILAGGAGRCCDFPSWDLSRGWVWRCHWLILVLILLAIGILGGILAYIYRKKYHGRCFGERERLPPCNGTVDINNPAFKPDTVDMDQDSLASNQVRPVKS